MRELLLEADKSHEKEKNTWQNPPKGTFRKFLHDVGITLVFQVHPSKNKGTRKRHDADESSGGREFFPDCRGSKNYSYADNNLDQNLHYIPSCLTIIKRDLLKPRRPLDHSIAIREVDHFFLKIWLFL